MVIVKIMGGLGNQMFQYAFARRIELEWGYEVKYDFSYYENIPSGDTKRDVYINRLISSTHIIAEEEVLDLQKKDKSLLKRILKKCGLSENWVVYESKLNDLTKIKDESYMVGFWQSEKFFLPAASVLRRELDFSTWTLSPASRELLKKIESTLYTTSIHIRAGDYHQEQNEKIFGNICTQNYYQKAYRYLKSKYPETIFFLFTNDVEWVRRHIDLPYEEMIVVPEYLTDTEDWEELFLMSKCKNNIIANSSYSWWAAWLNNHVEKIVISPSKWTNDNANCDTICNEWVRIEG